MNRISGREQEVSRWRGWVGGNPTDRSLAVGRDKEKPFRILTASATQSNVPSVLPFFQRSNLAAPQKGQGLQIVSLDSIAGAGHQDASAMFVQSHNKARKRLVCMHSLHIELILGSTVRRSIFVLWCRVFQNCFPDFQTVVRRARNGAVWGNKAYSMYRPAMPFTPACAP